MTSASEALIEASVPSCLVSIGELRGARQAFASAFAVPVLRVQQRGVIERAGDLIEQPELLEDLEALLVVDDRGLEIALVLMRLCHAGV